MPSARESGPAVSPGVDWVCVSPPVPPVPSLFSFCFTRVSRDWLVRWLGYSACCSSPDVGACPSVALRASVPVSPGFPVSPRFWCAWVEAGARGRRARETHRLHRDERGHVLSRLYD